MRTRSDEEKALSEELSRCMLGHYKYCAASMLISLPLSIHRKSYYPVALAAVAGTAADFMDGVANCKEQSEALVAYMARIEGAEATKARQAGGAQAASPLGGWPEQQQQQQQQSWPEKGWEDKGWEEPTFDGSDGGQDGGKEGKDKW